MINGLNNLNFPLPNNISNVRTSSSTGQKTPAPQNSVSSHAFDSASDSIRLSLSTESHKQIKNDKALHSPGNNTQIKISGIGKTKLTQAQLNIIRKLKISDFHVKNHEAKHMAIAGAYALGGPTFRFATGPDGKQYAVGGEIKLNTSPIPNNPSATIKKAIILHRGALAPSDPSGADLAVAAAASQMESQARQELTEKLHKERLKIYSSNL